MFPNCCSIFCTLLHFPVMSFRFRVDCLHFLSRAFHVPFDFLQLLMLPFRFCFISIPSSSLVRFPAFFLSCPFMFLSLSFRFASFPVGFRSFPSIFLSISFHFIRVPSCSRTCPAIFVSIPFSFFRFPFSFLSVSFHFPFSFLSVCF